MEVHIQPYYALYSKPETQYTINEINVINISNDIIQSVLSPVIPVNAEKFSKSISKFIEQGGKLTFNINPQNPLPIISTMGLFVMPDLAIESLGISLEAN